MNRAYQAAYIVYGTVYWGPAINGKRTLRTAPLAEFRKVHFTMVNRYKYEGACFTHRTANHGEASSALETS